jgi:hypothetical protein
MGTNGNIWKAVKIAKNLNVDSLPKNLTLGGKPVQKMKLQIPLHGTLTIRLSVMLKGPKSIPMYIMANVK